MSFYGGVGFELQKRLTDISQNCGHNGRCTTFDKTIGLAKVHFLDSQEYDKCLAKSGQVWF